MDKVVNWTGYSLDGKLNETITSNVTITSLTNSLHNITVYAEDTFGNIGSSETITFTVAYEPFPTIPVAATSAGASVAIATIGLIYYYKKRNH